MVINDLSDFGESEALVKMFHDCNIDIKARAETLTKEDFMCFVRKL